MIFAYILYGVAVPLDIFVVVTITTNLEMKVANQIMICVAVSYAIDFLIMQTIKALFQTCLVFYIYKTNGTSPLKKQAMKMLSDDLQRKIN